MIMPGKNINMSESLIGLGAFVLSILDNPKSIDDCWKELNEIYIDSGTIKKKHTFDNFILTIDLLYIMGSVNMNERGEIYNDIK